MDLRTSAGKPMLFSVDQSWNKQYYILSCLPQYESEARGFIPALLPFLRHKHGNSVDKFFTAAAIERHTLSTWDEQAQCVSNPEDEILEQLTHDDIEFDFEGLSATLQPADPPSLRPDPSRFVFAPGDDDSVSTIGTRDTTAVPRTAHVPPPQPLVTPPSRGSSRGPPNASRISSVSSVTPSEMSALSMHSRISSVEESMSQMKGTLDQILDRLTVTNTTSATAGPSLSQSQEAAAGDSARATGRGL